MAAHKVVYAKIPVIIEVPDAMVSVVEDVFNGEYESWFFGKNLTILDIGANIGSFTLWANLRWPNSRIHAYEPHPDTFKMLVNNVGDLPNVECHKVAVFPGNSDKDLFWSQYAGDGESRLVSHAIKAFENLEQGSIFEVKILHPQQLPSCDVLKIDTEGCELEILQNINLKNVSLILLEYESDEAKDSIKRLLSQDFSIQYEDSFDWDELLLNESWNYKKELAGNHYGTLFFSNKRCNHLTSPDFPLIGS